VSDPELRAACESLSADPALLLDTLARAWTKLANADRFAGPIAFVSNRFACSLLAWTLESIFDLRTRGVRLPQPDPDPDPDPVARATLRCVVGARARGGWRTRDGSRRGGAGAGAAAARA
jgi:hypothetical protein